jgi:hypothetical protein
MTATVEDVNNYFQIFFHTKKARVYCLKTHSLKLICFDTNKKTSHHLSPLAGLSASFPDLSPRPARGQKSARRDFSEKSCLTLNLE